MFLYSGGFIAVHTVLVDKQTAVTGLQVFVIKRRPLKKLALEPKAPRMCTDQKRPENAGGARLTDP